MTIQLDHFIVPAHDRVAAARLLAELLDVSWVEKSFGIFSAVYLNGGLTLDFVQTADPFPVHHYCFRVDQAHFDAILERIRARGIPYRSSVRGPDDRAVSHEFGGSGVYWNAPEGHQWEMLTVSYARPAM